MEERRGRGKGEGEEGGEREGRGRGEGAEGEERMKRGGESGRDEEGEREMYLAGSPPRFRCTQVNGVVGYVIS